MTSRKLNGSVEKPALINKFLPPPLRPGNSKTGETMGTWSRAAGLSCPGKSEPCWDRCYGRKAHYHNPSVINRLAINEAMWQQRNFVARVTAQILMSDIRTVRIHAVGDFDSPEYIQKWIDIVARNKKTTFLCYTRSWSQPELLPLLRKLAKFDNFSMWFSCDKATGKPANCVNAKRAYMACEDTDVPRYRVDLFFRAGSRKQKMVKMADTLVCPAERTPTKTVTCAQCRICVDRQDWLDQQNAKLRAVPMKLYSIGKAQGVTTCE